MNLKTILSFVLHSDLRARTRKSPGSDCALCAFSFKYVDTHGHHTLQQQQQQQLKVHLREMEGMVRYGTERFLQPCRCRIGDRHACKGGDDVSKKNII